MPRGEAMTPLLFPQPLKSNNWFLKAAEEMDVEVDDRLLQEASHNESKKKQQLADLKVS